MSQPPTNPQTPASTGSGKKILIIVLVVVGIILFVCCGGVVTCSLIARRAAVSAIDAANTAVAEAQAQALREQAALEKAQIDAQKDAQKTNPDNTAPGNTNPGNTPPTPPEETRTNGLDNLPAVRPPTGFPKDIPVYANSKIVISSAQNNTSFITATTKDPVDKIYDFYSTKLLADGWASTSNTEFNGIRAGTFSKDNRTLTVTVSPSSDNTMLTLTHESK